MVFAKLRDVVAVVGLKPWLSQVAPLFYNDHLIFYLLSRILSAILGALTVLPIYLWTKKLADNKSALLASAVLALTPLHVRNSHYALIDVPMLFFLSWSLYFSTYSPALSGLFLGFSASTKYNGLLGGLFIVVFLLLQKTKTLNQRLVDLVKLGLFTIVGFILGTPYSVLDFKTFTRTDGPQGALWQFTNVGKVGFLDQVTQFVNALSTKLPENLGYGALVVFSIGSAIILYSLVNRKHTNLHKGIVLSLAVFLILTFYVSGLEKNRSHYYLIVYPFFLAVAGWALAYLVDKIKQPVLKVALLLVALLPSLIMSIQTIVDLQTKTSSTIYGGDASPPIDVK
jgi:4-amino-4-deoxy-L-arabinose transferase-like glycosyltransferase